MIINMKAIYTSYHWLFIVHMLGRYTTSRTGTKDNEIRLGLPKSKFIMIPMSKYWVLSSQCSKLIIHKTFGNLT